MTIIAEPAPLTALARRFLAMPADRRAGFIASQSPEQVEILERAVAEEIAVGWRATPATMAHYLDRRGDAKLEPFQNYRYAMLLGEKFVDAVEGRSTRQIWNLPSQYGKPVDVREMVLMGDGTVRALGDIEVGDLVVTHLGRVRPVLAVYDQGVIPARRVTTASGRSVVAAPDHPFLTPEGWKAVEDLQVKRPSLPGDALAVVVPDALGATTRSEEEFRLTGYFIGDGSVTIGANGALSCNVTCNDPVEADDLYLCAEKMGWAITVTPRAAPHASRYGFRVGDRSRVGPRPWLRAAGLAGGTSHTKRVPAWVMSAPADMIAHFLGAYFACDGSVTRAGGNAQGRAVEFYSMNRPLLVDVRRLLARFGIAARLSRKWAATNNFGPGPIESWRLSVTGSDFMARFIESVPVFHTKSDHLRGMSVRRQAFDSRWLPDQVTGVDDAGLAHCRCLVVADDHSFVVDDLAVHNSTIASQWGPVWMLDRHPERKLILAAYGDNLTRRNSLFVLRTIREHSSVLRVALMRDQQQQDRFTTSAGGGLLATTIDGEATGFSAHGVVIDDPFKNWQDAHSANRRKHVLDQYRSVFRMRQTSDDMFVIVVMTRWHEEDLAGVLFKEGVSGDGEAWELVRFPEIAEDIDPNAPDPIMRVPDPLGRRPGEILEPRRFGEGAVAARRLSAGPYLWAGMHQQRPAPEEGNEIKRAWWKIEPVLPPNFDEIITSWDMKLKDKEAGDYVAGGTWGRVGSHFWQFGLLRGQWNQATTENAIALASVREPRARLHVIENTGNGPEVIASLREAKDDYVISDEMAGTLGMTEVEREAVQAVRRRGIPNVVGENVPHAQKAVRMRAHSGLIEGGSVHLWSEMPGLGVYLEEMSAFPNGSNDDQVDETSQALKRLRGGTGSVNAPSGELPRTPISRAGRTVGDIRPNLRYR